MRILPLAVAAAAVCIGLSSASSSASPKQDGPWRLVYATEVAGRKGLDVYVVSVPGGQPRRVAGIAGRDDFSPSWSPGNLLAYRQNPVRGDEGDIMLVPATGGRPLNLTRSPGVADWSPAFSPSGRQIAFFSQRSGGLDIWVMRSDGSKKRRLTRDGYLNEYPSWSPDGRQIAFQSNRGGQFDVFVMDSDGKRKRNLTRHPADDKWVAWSPDGRWIAFMSDRDGRDDVFVMRPDGSDVRNLTRTADLEESHPAWAPTGELTFLRYGETGPIELWTVHLDGTGERRLDTTVQPVFVFDWANR